MKNKTIGKAMSLLLATAMVGSLTACGGSGEGKKDKTVVEDGKTVIKVVRCTNNIALADGEEVQKVEDAINDYIADKIDVKVDITEIAGGEYPDKCNLALANNEINLLWTANWQGAVSCDSLYQADAVYDISDLLPGTTLYKSIPEKVWEASRYDGKDYFIPVYKEITEGYDLMFRKDLVDKYGWDLSSVKNLKDIEPMLEDCVNDDTVEAPFLTQATGFAYKYFFDKYDWIGGSSMYGVDKDTNKVVNIVGTDEYKEFCKLMCDWAAKGYIKEGDATKSNPSTAMTSQYWGISWWTDVPNNAEANTRYKQDVELVPMTSNWINSNSTLGSCYAISATSTEDVAKACIDFLGLLNTDKTVADLFTFGIEGTDYKRNGDGYVTDKGDRYNHSAWESCSIRSLSLEEGEPANKVELYEAFNNDAKESIATGFRLDKTPIEAPLAACTNVLDTYGFVLENGGYAPEDVDDALEEFQAALDEAGYQDVLKEVTRQYDEWKAQQ